MPKRGSPEQHTGKVCSFDCVSLALRSFADAWDAAAPAVDEEVRAKQMNEETRKFVDGCEARCAKATKGPRVSC